LFFLLRRGFARITETLKLLKAKKHLHLLLKRMHPLVTRICNPPHWFLRLQNRVGKGATTTPRNNYKEMRMTKTAADVNSLKHAPAVEGVIPAIHKRWSTRAFADKSVTNETLSKIFEAARWSASAYNEQPWRFLVGHKGDETYSRILGSLVEFNQQWAGKAPVLLLGVTKKTFAHNGTPNGFALYDLGAATSLLTLEAAELGLTTHSMAGLDADKARAAFGIPEDYAIGAAIALGYQGEPSTLTNERMLSQEVAPRTRKALSEIAFKAWETPATL
jgi:nitroreductase